MRSIAECEILLHSILLFSEILLAVEVDFSLFVETLDVLRVFRVEWHDSVDQNVENNACGVNVDLEVVLLGFENFRSHVTWSPTFLVNVFIQVLKIKRFSLSESS